MRPNRRELPVTTNLRAESFQTEIMRCEAIRKIEGLLQM
jgi:hypothetical protein